jgi:predicted 3-demethylubiquinone-9 3-methyltransferase (glyoxalase superfamily)
MTPKALVQGCRSVYFRSMQKISPFLWFNDQAEEAANFYVSIFKNSAILGVSRYGDGGPGPAGTAMSVSFVLDGLQCTALNGGPLYSFTEAISLFVTAETQDEVDDLWEQLTTGGEPGQCGWLKDSTVCRGRSSRLFCSSSWVILTRTSRAGSCRRCSG